MSHITAHVLDTTEGRPAAEIQTVLFQKQENDWIEIARGTTDDNGRISALIPHDNVLENGIYKMRFCTEEYFDRNSIPTFYPYIEIIFEITSAEHYHIPLLVSPFGYTTYRGS